MLTQYLLKTILQFLFYWKYVLEPLLFKDFFLRLWRRDVLLKLLILNFRLGETNIFVLHAWSLSRILDNALKLLIAMYTLIVKVSYLFFVMIIYISASVLWCLPVLLFNSGQSKKESLFLCIGIHILLIWHPCARLLLTDVIKGASVLIEIWLKWPWSRPFQEGSKYVNKL